MHKLKTRSTKNIIGLKLSGKLTGEEYAELIPILEQRIKEYGKIRLLIELDHWEGWGPYASLKDFVFVLKNSFKIERIAFLIKSKIDKQSILIDQPFTPWFGHQTKYFSSKEEDVAWRWVEEGIVDSPNNMKDKEGSAHKGKVKYGPKMKVLIIGGGVTGLTLANLLQQKGFEPTIVEASEEYPRTDRLFNCWAGGFGILKALGLYKKFLKNASTFDKALFYNHKGEFLKEFNLSNIFGEFGPYISIPHRNLIKLLTKKLSIHSLKVGIAATKLKETKDSVKVTFSDGNKLSYDCVVCADGVHSKLRELVFENAHPTYSGFIAWSFGIVPRFKFPKELSIYKAKDRFIILFPSSERLHAFVAIKHKEQIQQAKDKRLSLLKDSFKDFNEYVHNVIHAIEYSESIWHEGIYTYDGSRRSLSRIAFVGDAAYAFMPTTLLRGFSSLESTWLLSETLSRTDTQMLPEALKRYEVKSLKFINSIKSYAEEHRNRGFFSDEILSMDEMNESEIRLFFNKIIKYINEDY